MILAIIQARLSSTRLPGKVLLPIQARPLLDYMLERVQHAHLIDQIVVATSTDSNDNPIEEFCVSQKFNCYRGSLEDVLARYYQCAKHYQPKHIVRLTGDCPLIDPEIIDAVIQLHLTSDADYTSNAFEATFPDGLDTEIIKYTILEKLHLITQLPSQREHVTKYIFDHSEQFKISSYKNSTDLSALRWTVDNAEDFAVIQFIINKLYNHNRIFAMQEILELYNDTQNNLILKKNMHLQRNEGLVKSLIADRIFKENKV